MVILVLGEYFMNQCLRQSNNMAMWFDILMWNLDMEILINVMNHLMMNMIVNVELYGILSQICISYSLIYAYAYLWWLWKVIWMRY